MTYQEFLLSKVPRAVASGFKLTHTFTNVNNRLFSHQQDAVLWALRQGKAALKMETA